jgi:hypothetical protein
MLGSRGQHPNISPVFHEIPMTVFPLPCLRRALPGLIFLAALPAVRCAENPAAAVAPIGPALSVSELVHDFGTVPQGEPVHHVFKLTNTGSATLAIKDVKPSCGCTTTGEWPHTLKPGESGELPINLETAHFVGGVTKTITIKSNDATRPEQVIELKATVWTPVKISDPVIIFPAVTDPKVPASRTVTIDNQVEGALSLSDVLSDNPLFKPDLKELTPGKQFELKVTTVPPLLDGTQTARIRMKSSNAKMPELTVQAVVTVLPPIQVAPTELMFSTHKLAAAEKRFAVVLNHRNANLEVSDLTTNAKGVELSTNMGPDRKQFTITLTFPAGFEIHADDQLYLRGKTNQPSTPTFEIPIVYAGDR